MKKFLYIIVILMLGLCMTDGRTWASKAYVTDSFHITFRTGPSIENKVVKYLISGEPVEILGSQEGWSRVRLLDEKYDKMEGWVLSRYMVERLPWKIQAESLRKENTGLKEKLVRIEKDSEELATMEKRLIKKIKEDTEVIVKLRGEYEKLKKGSAGYVKLKAAYDNINRTVQASQKEIETLTMENDSMKNSQRNRWFATGALVLLCGLLIGLLVGRQQKKRSSYY
ncbi:MAG: TIGR04211 family SH3 domain-containing protein [Thermodesulfobacteriota bacterium]|nr:TIGR04211 family SH3 domain-containing protein [Thermodesulfobacteriota bacterium]